MSRISRLIGQSNYTDDDPDISELPALPSKEIVVVTCMDTRINPYHILNIDVGDVHLLRNAGGIVTEDIVRSILISQRKLGTREVIVIQHTDCGMMKFKDDELKAEVESETNEQVTFTLGSFSDLTESVRSSVEFLKHHPLLDCENVQGYIYDVHKHQLVEVT